MLPIDQEYEILRVKRGEFTPQKVADFLGHLVIQKTLEKSSKAQGFTD